MSGPVLITMGASASSGNINKGLYIAPGTEPKSRWMPKNLTASQKRRLQRLLAQTLREKKAEGYQRFNELRPPNGKIDIFVYLSGQMIGATAHKNRF